MGKIFNADLNEYVWTAAQGKIYKRKADGIIVGTMLVRFAPSDSIENYEEVDIQEEVNE